MESQNSYSTRRKIESWVTLAFCVALLAAGVLQQIVPNRPDYALTFAPDWLPFTAALVAAAAMIQMNSRPQWQRVQRILLWSSLLLMVWAANGLPLDLLRIAGLMPAGVDWPGLATRALSLVSTVMLARFALAGTESPLSIRAPGWYGYTALLLALPYPVLRTIWALGGTLGLTKPAAAGEGFIPWLACIPWLLAAVLSLLLVLNWRWIPRRWLLTAGWSATVIVAMIGPAACWSLIAGLAGGDLRLDGISIWIPCLFYGSWLLWAIAAGAATRSYQLRSAAISIHLPTGHIL